MIIVVSTAKGNPEAAVRSCESVRNQRPNHHWFMACDNETFEAVREVPAVRLRAVRSHGGQIWNLLGSIECANPYDVIVWLDGDDYLEPGAIARVEQEYARHDCWLTYGSFRLDDGRRDYEWHPPFGRRYIEGVPVRAQSWRASHLRTFRAGLFQAIPRAYLERAPNTYFDTCTDRAIMLAMLEMAGERYRVIQDVLCVYNTAHTLDPARADIDRETEDRCQIHAMPALAPLTEKPW